MSDVIFALGIGAAATFFQSLLLLAIFRKAGFGIVPTLAALLPFVAVVVPYPLVFSEFTTSSEAALLAVPLTLAPFMYLAFKSWPQATRNSTSPETFS